MFNRTERRVTILSIDSCSFKTCSIHKKNQPPPKFNAFFCVAGLQSSEVASHPTGELASLGLLAGPVGRPAADQEPYGCLRLRGIHGQRGLGAAQPTDRKASLRSAVPQTEIRRLDPYTRRCGASRTIGVAKSCFRSAENQCSIDFSNSRKTW